jgi:hypothetical protein
MGKDGSFVLRNGGDRSFDHVEALVELRIGYDEGNQDADDVIECARRDNDQTVLATLPNNFLGFRVGRLACFDVAHQFDGTHAT